MASSTSSVSTSRTAKPVLPLLIKSSSHSECSPDCWQSILSVDLIGGPHFHSEVQHRPFPQRGRSPSVGNGRKAWSAAPGRRGSGPGMAVVPSVCRLSGLSGRRNASAGLGRVRPGAGRAQPDRSPDGRDGEILSTPFLRAGGRRSRGVREGGPCAAPRRASGSPAPGADARPCGPAPPSPPRR